MVTQFVQQFGKLKPAFSRRARLKRMKAFISRVGLQGGERVIDFGGLPVFWAEFPRSLDITIVNLPGSLPESLPDTHHEIRLIEGDACHLPEFDDKSFDIGFSNSVIEHVGGAKREALMAGEVRRLCKAYWVQTPSIHFPIEAHTNLPFWWLYPRAVRARIISSWHETLPLFAEMVEETVVISRKNMEDYFPDGELYVERWAGITKSYSMYKSLPQSDMKPLRTSGPTKQAQSENSNLPSK